jgi:hypothetical protein
MKSWHKSALASAAAIAMVAGAIVAGVQLFAGLWMPVVFGALVTTILTLKQKDSAERRWALRHGNHWHLFIGVFFTFASLGPVIVLSMMWVKIPGLAIAVSLFAGLIASGWAATSLYRMWWAVPILIAFQAVFTMPYFETGSRIGLFAWGAKLLRNGDC